MNTMYDSTVIFPDIPAEITQPQAKSINTSTEPLAFEESPIFKKYSLEDRREQIREQALMIRTWANEQGLKEGVDFRIVEDVTEVIGNDAEVVPHETKAFYLVVLEKHYQNFRDYFVSQYKDEMKLKDPNNEARLDYSWGGRFCVAWAGIPCDTVAASNIEKLSVPTHHQEFKDFFKAKTGFEFPSARTLNSLLGEMSAKSLSLYESMLVKLYEMRDTDSLPDDGYGLIDGLIHAVELLKKAKTGKAVAELPEELTGEMPIEMRAYADITYNIEDIADFGRAKEITGIEIPEDARIDKIFERFNFDRNNMEQICKDFSGYLMAKREISN